MAGTPPETQRFPKSPLQWVVDHAHLTPPRLLKALQRSEMACRACGRERTMAEFIEDHCDDCASSPRPALRYRRPGQ